MVQGSTIIRDDKIVMNYSYHEQMQPVESMRFNSLRGDNVMGVVHDLLKPGGYSRDPVKGRRASALTEEDAVLAALYIRDWFAENYEGLDYQGDNVFAKPERYRFVLENGQLVGTIDPSGCDPNDWFERRRVIDKATKKEIIMYDDGTTIDAKGHSIAYKGITPEFCTYTTDKLKSETGADAQIEDGRYGNDFKIRLEPIQAQLLARITARALQATAPERVSDIPPIILNDAVHPIVAKTSVIAGKWERY